MTDQMTNTEPARPDLEGMLRRAGAATEGPWRRSGYGWNIVNADSTVSVSERKPQKYGDGTEYFPLPDAVFISAARQDVPDAAAYALRLESELAAMTADREILLHDCVEQMNRADSEKQRADSAEKQANELRNRIFPPVKSVVITAPMAPALSIQELCAPIAANLSPEQSTGGSEGKE